MLCRNLQIFLPAYHLLLHFVYSIFLGTEIKYLHMYKFIFLFAFFSLHDFSILKETFPT